VYIRCIYGIFGREITKYTVYIYGSGQPYNIRCMYGVFYREITNHTIMYGV